MPEYKQLVGGGFANVTSQGAPAEDMGMSRVLDALANPVGVRIALICAESGMGKSSILSQCVQVYMSRGIPCRLVDFHEMTSIEAYERFREIDRWRARQSRRDAGNNDGANGGLKAFVACDNLPVGDEADNTRLVGIIRKLSSEGCYVAIATSPDGELLYEQMGEALCFWSCDLCMKRPADVEEARMYDEFTLGIPRLVFAVGMADEREAQSLPTDPSYQEPYLQTLESTIRTNMMGEEKRLRCATLLLGSGTKADLEKILGGVDDVLWRLLPRDAPFFGVDVAHGTFCCVGSYNQSCLNMAYASLSSLVRPWPRVVAQCARMLALRGNILRAAVVSLMCRDDKERCAIAMSWGVAILDAGEVSVVADALETVRNKGLFNLAGYEDTALAFGALVGDVPDDASKDCPEGRLEHRSRQAYMAMRCRALLEGRDLAKAPIEARDDNRLSHTLVVHAKTLHLLACGRLGEAYDLLLRNTQRLDSPTISLGLVQVDYVFCSLLVGVVPTDLDVSALDNVTRFFERAGLGRLATLSSAALSAGMLLGGRLLEDGDFDLSIQRAVRREDALLRGLLLLVTGVSDLRLGALMRSRVRLGQAASLFDGMEAQGLCKATRLLHCAVSAELGESITQPSILACKGVSPAMDVVVNMLASAFSSKRPGRLAASRLRGLAGHVRDVHWVVNILMNDCGSVSRRFRKILPQSWEDEETSIIAALDAFVEESNLVPTGRLHKPSEDGKRPLLPPRSAVQGSCVEIHMMGGFEVRVEGTIVPGNRLDKRRSRALLALLAAVPGHEVKRYMIMETVWPSYDYHSANKCVYSATSALRSEIGSLLSRPLDGPLIVSNKAQGTVALNMAVVGCDADVFEREARELLDMEGEDRDTVVRCRRIEDLYLGDLFVPPTDGMGIIETRSRELRELFADVMVAGAWAALRSGMKMLACRFARKAHSADKMREDAIMVLVCALCSAGRHVEAERCFEHYVGHVVDITKRPPSRRLRERVEQYLGGALSQGSEVQSRNRQDEGGALGGFQLALRFDEESADD